jgi:hypothetical protein
LEVCPFAGLAGAVPRHVPRLLINRDRVGSFGNRPHVLILLGDLVETLKQLTEALWWSSDLEQLCKSWFDLRAKVQNELTQKESTQKMATNKALSSFSICKMKGSLVNKIIFIESILCTIKISLSFFILSELDTVMPDNSWTVDVLDGIAPFLDTNSSTIFTYVPRKL